MFNSFILYMIRFYRVIQLICTVNFTSKDVYDAIPTIVTTFVAIIAKISIFIFLLGLVHYTSKPIFGLDFSWTTSLLFSSVLSLVIGTVVGLTQSRIKRLFAFSTISHVGFILLGLSIHTVESTQAFMFYLIQYSISNLNAFILIITIGYSLYSYVYDGNIISSIENSETVKKDTISDIQEENSSKQETITDKEKQETMNSLEKPETLKEINEQSENHKIVDLKNNLHDVDNSPIQLIDQLKGYYYINPLLSLSLGITLFSFAGIPPLIGFFGKQMILSAAIDNGYIFMVLVAILTSVISAVYYLTIIKQIFFDPSDYTLSKELNNFNSEGLISEKNTIVEKISIKINNIVISTSLSMFISVITLVITLFMLLPEELLNLANILALILFNL